MEKERDYGGHVVLLPFHGQGHINPMVQFAKRLDSKGIKITIATMSSTSQVLQQASDSFTVITIYDDDVEGGIEGPGGVLGFIDRFGAAGFRNLSEFIEKQKGSEYPVKCIVYDADMKWPSDVASKLEIARAALFTESCAAICTYYPMHCEVAGKEVPLPSFPVSGLPKLRFPASADSVAFSPVFMHILRQFDGIDKADWVLFNTFHMLDDEAIRWLSRVWRVGTIGPTVPSTYLDKRLETDCDYVFNIHKPNTDTCLNFLNNCKTGSVVYVSYGSVTRVSAEQIEEIAEALGRISDNFLWVVKPAEESKLPRMFKEETSDKGIVVTWCPQLEVLAHKAIGCFVSHCGWNSTMEAISFSVPVVAVPQFLDQTISAHFVENVWKVGVVCKADEDGFTRGEDLEKSIGEVMHGDRGKEMRKNAIRWKELAKEAISEGGSSDRCIDEMVAELK